MVLGSDEPCQCYFFQLNVNVGWSIILDQIDMNDMIWHEIHDLTWMTWYENERHDLTWMTWFDMNYMIWHE
jgi:hypothetical protein